MQTIYLDLAQKNVLEHIHAKQGDVGRKFEAVLLDNGKPYPIERGTVFTVWYSGASGEGNYSSVGNTSAIQFQDNVLQIELTTQMLTCHGGGTMCIVMHKTDGTQIGFWNLIYFCEPVPGINSMEATKHYTALSEVAQRAINAAATFETDENFHFSGVAADAKAVGNALKEKAPNGFGLGSTIRFNTMYVMDLNNSTLKTGFYTCTASTKNVPDESFGGGPLLVINWQDDALIGQFLLNNDLTQFYYRQYTDGIWSAWKYLNPPMKVNTEYATMEKWNEQTVYTRLIHCGNCTNGLYKSFGETLHVIRFNGRIGNVVVPSQNGAPGSPTKYAHFSVNSEGIQLSCTDSVELIGLPVYCHIWYTKN